MDRIKPSVSDILLDYISYPIPGANLLNHADRCINNPGKKWPKFIAGASALSVYNDMVVTAYSDPFLRAYGTLIETFLGCLK